MVSLGTVASLAGCTSSSSRVDETGTDSPSSTPRTSTPTIHKSDVELTIHPKTDGTSTRTRERVAITNESDRTLPLEEYRLEYDSGESYTFGALQLEAGTDVLVVSQGSGDGALKSNPPTYVRDAEFDSLVLSDGYGKVSVVAPDGTVVKNQEYGGY